MPNVPPGQWNKPGASGATPTPDKYPQWGVKQVSGTPGYGTAASDYKTVEAKTAAGKTTYLGQGYDVWFASAAKAQDYINGQVGNAKNPVTQAANATASAISSVVDFLKGFASGNLWIRVVKVMAGGAMVIVGLVKLTGLDARAPGVVRTAVKVAPLL